MTTTSSTASNGLNALVASQDGKTTSAASKTTEASDRFLKLLVTQMQNQDPLNPMDNAQVTSQMAQINTVTGIEKLNTTMTDFGSSFSQMQMLQGAGLVGHQVLIEGNKLTLDSNKQAVGAFNLNANAKNVSIDVISTATGKVVDTIEQGTLESGRHDFSWTAPTGSATQDYTFKVNAKTGSTDIGSTSMMVDTVDAVSNSDGTLNLELRNSGTLAYTKVKAVG